MGGHAELSIDHLASTRDELDADRTHPRGDISGLILRETLDPRVNLRERNGGL